MCQRSNEIGRLTAGGNLQRDRSLDALKGLAIVLVVAGHAIVFAATVDHAGAGLVQIDSRSWLPLQVASGLLLNLIYSFHMPLFAFVSGFVLWRPHPQPLVTKLKRRVTGLLVPYFAWFVALYAAAAMFHPVRGFLTRLADVVLRPLPAGGLWYLYALLVCAVFLSLLQELPGAAWIIPLSAIALWPLRVLLVNASLFDIGQVLWIYPFVVLGFEAARFGPSIRSRRIPLIATGVFAFALLLFLAYPVFGPGPARIAGAMQSVHLRGGFAVASLAGDLAAAAAVIALFAFYSGRTGWWVEAQAWFGRRSLGIYAMHALLIQLMIAARIKDPVIVFLGSLGVSTAATLVLERIPVLRSLLLGSRLRAGTEGASLTPLSSDVEHSDDREAS